MFRLATMTARQLEGQELAYQTEFVLVFVLGDHLDQQARKLQQDPQVLKEILEILDQPDLEESKVQQRQQVQQDLPTRLKLNYKMVREVGILLLKLER